MDYQERAVIAWQYSVLVGWSVGRAREMWEVLRWGLDLGDNPRMFIAYYAEHHGTGKRLLCI